MESIIKNGITILTFTEKETQSNNTSGVNGVYIDGKGKYKPTIRYNNKRYNLGSHRIIEEAKMIRETAEEKIKDGTFIEWYEKTFPHKNNKYGVKGLSKRTGSEKYSLAIIYCGKKYALGDYRDIEDAALVRAEADKHIEDGTFHEWFNENKSKIQNRKAKK